MSAELATLDFPPPAAPGPFQLAPPVPADVALRPATGADLGFLRALYGELRAEELARVPWPEPLKCSFLDQQFALQHRHYVARHPAADFLVIERAGRAVGRLYLDRGGADWQLIDLGLLAAARGGGLGGALLRRMQALAGTCGANLALHVQRDNLRARALYERLGFRAGALAGHHLAMRWAPDGGVS